MASTPIRVVVAEHQPLIRRALVGLFENTPGLRIEAVAANGHSALAEIAALLPDVAVIDVRLPKHHDLSLLHAIRARGLRSRVVLLTTRPATDRPSLTGGIAASVSIADDEEKITACTLSKAAGADFVKTSTGFGPGGATAADVALMRRVVGEEMGVKAAGGVRDLDGLKAMVEAGASRVGASAGVKIVQQSAGKTVAASAPSGY